MFWIIKAGYEGVQRDLPHMISTFDGPHLELIQKKQNV